MEKKTVIINVQTEDGVKQLDRLSAKFDEVYGEVLPLTGAIGELEDQLYEMAKRGEQGTDEFKTLAAEAGRLKKTIAQVDMEVDALSMTTANKLGGALGGAASGFELVQGAMGAMGAESEAVEAALLKVQSAMAIAQGVQGVKEALPAFKALGGGAISAFKGMTSAGKAFAITGIGLILTALAAAVAAMDAFTDSSEKAAEAQKKLEDDLAKTNKQIEDQSKLTASLTQLTDDMTRRELIDAKKRGATEEELTKIKRDGARERIRILEDEEATALKLYQKKSRYGSYKEAVAAEEAWLKTTEATKNARMTLEEEEADESLAIQREAADRAAEARKAAAERRKAEQEKEKQDKIDAFEEDKKRSEELLNAGALFSDKAATRREEDIQEIKTAEQTKYDIITYYQNELLKKQEAAAANEKAIKERNKSFIIENAEETFQFISDLATIFEGKSEASQKRAFKIRKAAAIAQTTVETFKAAQTAYASQIVPLDPTSPVRGAIAAAFAVASGLAKVKAIASTKFEGGGATGGATGGGGGGGSAPAASTPAQFNIVGNSGTNQIAEGLANQTVKAFVTEGDVSSAQQLQRNKITTISL